MTAWQALLAPRVDEPARSWYIPAVATQSLVRMLKSRDFSEAVGHVEGRMPSRWGTGGRGRCAIYLRDEFGCLGRWSCRGTNYDEAALNSRAMYTLQPAAS